MAKPVPRNEAPAPVAVARVISYQPAGVRNRGRGVAFEWSLPTVREFVEKGIELKRARRAPPGNTYIVAYDRVPLRTLEMIRRWLHKAERADQQIVEVPSRGIPKERYNLGGYITIAGWFGKFIHDGLYQSVYCPRCDISYAKDRLKFVILGPCPSGQRGRVRECRAPTGQTCPEGHLLIRD